MDLQEYLTLAVIRTARVVVLLFTAIGFAGCSHYVAHLIVTPNDRHMPVDERLLDGMPYADHVAFSVDTGSVSTTLVAPQQFEFDYAFTVDPENRSVTSALTLQPADPQLAMTASPHGTVVLLHGFALNRHVMGLHAAMFADAGFTTVAADLPGFGDSTGDYLTYGKQERLVINGLQKRLQEAGFPPPFMLFGLSYGGAMALHSAAITDAWAGVIAMQPYNDAREVIANFERFAPRALRPFVGGNTIARAISRAERRGDFDLAQLIVADALSEYHVPTLILHSAGDQLVPVEQSRTIAAASETIELHIDRNGGDHMRYPLRISLHCKAILDWLARSVLDANDVLSTDTCQKLEPELTGDPGIDSFIKQWLGEPSNIS